jgi:hypothetical protein
MRGLRLSRYALWYGVAAASLIACGASQPPIGAPGTVSQGPAIAAHGARGGSWMLSRASSGGLVYVSDSFGTTVDVFSYPGGTLVGQLTGFEGPQGLCSDRKGNVWITNGSPPEVIEYQHGGTQPIAELGSEDPFACSVDPTTGNLAVTNSNPGKIAIYKNASGNPTYYSSPNFPEWEYCAYDNHGNLFAGSPASSDLAELPAGSGTIEAITLDKSFALGSMQWHKKYLAIADAGGSADSPTTIYQVRVLGSDGTVTGKSALKSAGKHREGLAVQYWITGSAIVGPDKLYFNFWRYPKGGRPTKVIRHLDQQLWGTTVSAAP